MNMTVAAFVLKLMNRPVMEYYIISLFTTFKFCLRSFEIVVAFSAKSVVNKYLCILSKS